MFKPFYVHRQHWAAHHPEYRKEIAYNGFSAFVQPVEDFDRMLKVQWTMCSKKDKFCKATGRAQLAAKPLGSVIINKRDLPDFIGGLVYSLDKDSEDGSLEYCSRKENFLLKYVL